MNQVFFFFFGGTSSGGQGQRGRDWSKGWGKHSNKNDTISTSTNGCKHKFQIAVTFQLTSKRII